LSTDPTCTLNLARRSAAAATNRKPTAHPSRPSGCRPQVNDRIDGAIPNDTTSASESSSMPKSLVEPVIRAMRPSSMSSTIAKPMNGAAIANSPRIA
jgi:hypothetical protein